MRLWAVVAAAGLVFVGLTAGVWALDVPPAVREARARWPHPVEEPAAFLAAWSRIPLSDRGAILYDGAAWATFTREFGRMDGDRDGEVSWPELRDHVIDFNGDVEELDRCLAECHSSAGPRHADEPARCGLLGWAAARGVFDAHCTPTMNDELSNREADVLADVDELLRTGDPASLGLVVDENGIIVD